MAQISYEALKQKYAGSSSSKSSSGSSSSSSRSSSNSYSSIFDKYEQNEKRYNSAKECVYDLRKYDKLFNRNVVDGYDRIDEFLQNKEWLVTMDVDGDGQITGNEENVQIADAIALSFDSELDLYIQEKLEEVINNAGEQNLRNLFGTKDSIGVKQLALLGIRIDAVGNASSWQNRTYSFSLVELPDDIKAKIAEAGNDEDKINAIYDEVYDAVYDKDAKILTDKNGKKGSMIFSDCLIPDGVANGAEINLSSILDTLGGYECISKADFIGREDDYFELMDNLEMMINNGEFQGTSTIADLYSENTLDVSTAVRAVYTANGDAPGQWGGARSFEDNLKLIERNGLGSTGSSSSSTIRVNGVEYEINLTDGNLLSAQEYTEKIEKFDEILEEKIATYKQENNGDDPDSITYNKFVNEATLEAKIDFSFKQK